MISNISGVPVLNSGQRRCASVLVRRGHAAPSASPVFMLVADSSPGRVHCRWQSWVGRGCGRVEDVNWHYFNPVRPT
eukprot:SAG31_NODE_5446_length_2533_cov_1.336072_4_plen_77_part_00